jgi:hypothetical protein
VPVFFRQLPVGQVAGYELDPAGKGVTVKVFVNEPYTKYVNANTRFWNASGVKVKMDASGIKLELLFALAGCGRSPKKRFYTLGAGAAPARVEASASYSIAVGPVTIPAIVDRPQLVAAHRRQPRDACRTVTLGGAAERQYSARHRRRSCATMRSWLRTTAHSRPSAATLRLRYAR